MSDRICMGGSSDDSLSTTATQFFQIEGESGPQTNEALAFYPIAVACTLDELVVEVLTDPSSGSYDFHLMVDGSPSALTVNIAGGETRDTDTSNSVSITAGQFVSIRTTPNTPGVGVGRVRWSMKFASTTSAQYFTGGGATAKSGTGADRYIAPLAGQGWNATLTIVRELIIPHDTTVDSLYIKLSGSSSLTARIVRNGTEVGSTLTISSADNGSVTSLAIDLVPGDSISVRINVTGANPRAHVGVGFTADTAGESILGGSQDDSPAANATEFTLAHAQSGGAGYNSTEDERWVRVCGITGFDLKNMIVEVTTAAGASEQYEYFGRKNQATDLNSVVISGASEVQDSNSLSDSLVDGDEIDLKVVGSTSATLPGEHHWAWVQLISEAGVTTRRYSLPLIGVG